jgi:hypothetical protein
MMGDYQTEDKIIEDIAAKGVVTVKIGGAVDPDQKVFENLPATNCVKLFGTGPRKVVFMRGKSWNSNVGTFIQLIDNVLSNGFARIDPYAKYYSQFSFYGDLKKIDEDSLSHDPEFPTFTPGAADIMKANSSCFGVVDNSTRYVLYHDMPVYEGVVGEGIHPAFTLPDKNTAFINSVYNSGMYIPGLTIHEMSHTLAKLLDEYIKALAEPVGSFWNYKVRGAVGVMARNCTTSPRTDYRGSDHLMYGDITSNGCGFIYEPGMSPKIDPRTYYRPSAEGIMNTEYAGELSKFSVIDCGYVVAGIKGEEITTRNAQKYWPECMGMNTIKDGIPIRNPAPTISNTSAYETSLWSSVLAQVTSPFSGPTITPGFKVILSGSGFTTEYNDVQFENVVTKEIYEVRDIPSENLGRSLSFYAPTSTSPGDYTMKVGAFNSPWSAPVSVKIAVSAAPTLIFASRPSTTLRVGQSATFMWEAQGVSTCVSSSNVPNLPKVWTSPDRSGTFLFTPTGVGNYSFTLTCEGSGGIITKTASLNVVMSSQSYPLVSLTTTPTSVNAGEGSTVTWSAINASSCKKTGTGDPSVIASWTANSGLTGSLYVVPYATTTLAFNCLSASATPLSAGVTTTLNVTSSFLGKLAVTCSSDPVGTASVYGDLVTWMAKAVGGNGQYTYSWKGTDGLVGSVSTVSRYYKNSGLKTAIVNVTSAGMSAVGSCTVSASTKAPIVVNDRINIRGIGISPSSGIKGTSISLSPAPAMSFPSTNNGAVAVHIGRDGQTLYVKPDVSQSAISFVFDPSLPLAAPIAGDTYQIQVRVMTGGGETFSDVKTFTYGVIASSSLPVISSITPLSSPLNSEVVITGTGITSSSVIVLRHAGMTKIISPLYTPGGYGAPTKLTFLFTGNIAPGVAGGDYDVRVSTNGIESVPVKFIVTTEPPRITLAASPDTLEARQTSVIAWTVLGADPSQCLATGFNFPQTLSGSVSITPVQDTFVSLGCTGPGGNANKTVLAKVTSTTPPTVTPSTTPPVIPNVIIPSTPPTILAWTGPSSIRTGETLQFTLNWSGGPFATSPHNGEEWKIFVHLRQKNGGAIPVSTDFYSTPLPSKWGTTKQTPGSVLIPTGTPAGEYDVLVGMYVGSYNYQMTPGAGVTNVGSSNYSIYKVGSITVGGPTSMIGDNMFAALFEAIGRWLAR